MTDYLKINFKEPQHKHSRLVKFQLQVFHLSRAVYKRVTFK